MQSVQDVATAVQRVISNVEKVIVGKGETVAFSLIAVICRGHVLIEDVPGVGKTVLTKAIARSIGCTFKRIQFTPDLLPSDVTGTSIYNQKTGNFEFRPGPVMAQIVLADEINRATPKTQSALLESMEEGQITVDGVSYRLPEPFMVMATQNPIEYEGTFPLPEAQLDRFMMNISIGYPKANDEMNILDTHQHHHPLDDLAQIMTAEELVHIQQQIRTIYVDPSIREYIVNIASVTRRPWQQCADVAMSSRTMSSCWRSRLWHIASLSRPLLVCARSPRLLFWKRYCKAYPYPMHGSAAERDARLCDPGKQLYSSWCCSF